MHAWAEAMLARCNAGRERALQRQKYSKHRVYILIKGIFDYGRAGVSICLEMPCKSVTQKSVDLCFNARASRFVQIVPFCFALNAVEIREYNPVEYPGYL